MFEEFFGWWPVQVAAGILLAYLVASGIAGVIVGVVSLVLEVREKEAKLTRSVKEKDVLRTRLGVAEQQLADAQYRLAQVKEPASDILKTEPI
jgi:hypothetical protein